MATNIDKFVEPSEIPGSVAVPLGGIIGWMNPNPAAMNPSPPAGFEFCDGTAVTTVGSPYLGQIKPNLMVTSAGGAKGFMRGANVTAAPYGVGTAIVTGGVDSHSHGGSTSSVSDHSHSLQNHTHSISSDGSHFHTLLGPTSGEITFNPATPAGPDTQTNNAGTHSHGGATGTPSNNTSSSAGGHSHSISANSVSHLPVFAEVAQIVRVI